MSPKECTRKDRNGADTARHPPLRGGRVDRGASGNPRSLSEMLKRRPSNKGSSASGVDSKEEDDDWRLWCRRVGVWGVIDSAANSSVNSGRKVWFKIRIFFRYYRLETPRTSGEPCASGVSGVAGRSTPTSAVKTPTLPKRCSTARPRPRSWSRFWSRLCSSDSWSASLSRWPSATLHHSMSANTLLLVVSEPEERLWPLPRDPAALLTAFDREG